MKIGFLSDLHITHNADMIEQVLDIMIEATSKAKIDKLFLAGDTTNNYKMTLEFVDMLAKLGIDIYTIFGNHEYWSIDYEKAQRLNHDRYINGKTIELDNNNVVIGIDGFFDYSFVTEVDNVYTRQILTDKKQLTQIGIDSFDLDRNRIKNYEETFNAMEELLLKQLEIHKNKNITLITHYVPSEKFVLYNNDNVWTSINAFMGSKRYQEMAESYGVKKVIFGHTHSQFNETINGVDYHCNPIGYKSFEFDESFRERVKSRLKIFEI